MKNYFTLQNILMLYFAKNEEDNQIIIITAYYPDKDKWSNDYKTRIKK